VLDEPELEGVELDESDVDEDELDDPLSLLDSDFDALEFPRLSVL
jgi:hypothetical protein